MAWESNFGSTNIRRLNFKMLNIAYTGLHPETISQVLSCVNKDSILFTEVPPRDFYKIEGKQDVLMIGEDVENPLQLAQQVHKLDEQLSVLIIKDKQDFPACKQELLFTPFVGKTVNVSQTRMPI